jgi:predicted unusual protein kinase regulating ubiquinone biosynthesis (AarF/ABC1/UbiB family)
MYKKYDLFRVNYFLNNPIGIWSANGIIRLSMEKRRYRRIIWFFAKILLVFVVWDLVLPKFGLRKLVARTRPDRLRRSARAFRMLAIQMGGVLIKVGQFLSSRVDVLPDEIVTELEGLQDEVPAENFQAIKNLAEKELGQPLTQIYTEFDESPLAAASLGQVHWARLSKASNGDDPAHNNQILEDVVVKVQRPDIELIIATDLAALRTVGGWLRHYPPLNLRVDISALLAEFTRILYEEIDYLSEGRNAEIFAQYFVQELGIRIPKVYWSQTTKKVLTLENVMAIKITDYQKIDEAGIDRKKVASRLLNTYLKQIFEDGFFHADPHPGNLFIYPMPGIDEDEESKWALTFVDFGAVGKVPPKILDGLREMLIAVGTKDAARMVRSYQMLGVLLPHADLALIEKAEAKAFERFWGKTMTELQQIHTQEVKEFVREFRELIYTMPFQIPHNMIYLVRTVGILSGICTGLDPEFNVWQHIAPYAQKLIARESFSNLDGWLAEIKKIAGSIFTFPAEIKSAVNKINHGEIEVRAPEVSQHITRLVTAVKQLVAGIIFCGLLLGGVQLYIFGLHIFGILLICLSGICLVYLLLTPR